SAVSRDGGTGGALTSAPFSSRMRPTSTYPPEAASIRGVIPVFTLCLTFAFQSNRRDTTSLRPLEQAAVRAVLRFLSIWALTLLPLSSRSLTVAACPFLAANMRGEMPDLDPVRESTSAPCCSSNSTMLTKPQEAAIHRGEKSQTLWCSLLAPRDKSRSTI